MGDTYSFDGRIEITPPLNFKEIRTVRAALHTHLIKVVYGGKPSRWVNTDLDSFAVEDHFSLALSVQEMEQETDDGILTLKRAETISPVSSESGSRSCTMMSQMEAIIKALPKHNFKGSVTMIEDSGSRGTKLVVEGRKVSEYKGTGYIKFEDGSEEKILD